MAIFEQIKARITTKYESLPNKKDKLEFLYEVQESLRIRYNKKGTEFRTGIITQKQWENFKNRWLDVSNYVAINIASIRDEVFKKDYLFVNEDISVKSLSVLIGIAQIFEIVVAVSNALVCKLEYNTSIFLTSSIAQMPLVS